MFPVRTYHTKGVDEMAKYIIKRIIMARVLRRKKKILQKK